MKIKLLYFLFTIFTLSEAKAQTYIEFVENKGQWDSDILFNGQIGYGQFALTKSGYRVLKYDEKTMSAAEKHNHQVGFNNNTLINGHVWNVSFLNANPNFRVATSKKVEGVRNYYIGNEPSKWGSNCSSFNEITYQDIYDKIDINYYTNNGTLKYDILLKPGADPGKLKFRYEGMDKIVKGKRGELYVQTSVGNFEELAPYTYQVVDNKKVKVACSYKINNGELSFRLGDYDPTKLLIIDPTLIFSTHSGSTEDNWGFTATYGPDETFYGAGDVRGAGFPVSTGAFQTTFGNGIDIGIIKLNQNGTSRIYATYIGGSLNEQPHSLICDPQGNLIVAGRTNSVNYPTTTGAFGTRGGYDIVITKLNANGTALIGSVIVAGSGDDGVNISPSRTARTSLQYNYGDDGRSEVNMDGSGNIILASCTQSANFFTTANAAQSTIGGNQDGVILKANANLSSILFCSFFGGSGNDAAYVVNIKPDDGDIYFAGGTESPNLPGDKTGVFQPTLTGSADGFITVVKADGSAIVRTTYLGTPSHDQIYGIQFDKNNFPYVMGISLGSWPVSNVAFSNPGSHQFISKLDKTLSTLVYSTKFGTNQALTNISPVAFLVDRCENVYVSGWGGDVSSGYGNAGTTGMQVTSDALKSTTDGNDFYYFVLEKNGASQLFGSFFGGNQSASLVGEHVDGGTSRFDPKGAIYQAACASCGVPNSNPGALYTFTSGSWSPNNGSSNCNLGMTKIRFNLTGVGSDLRASDTNVCVGATINFNDAFLNAVSYEFNFGDGPSVFQASPNISHTFNTVGVFRVMMVAIDLNSCNLRDTSYRTVRVRGDRAVIDFNGIKQPPCLNLTYQFNNLSIAPPGKPFSNNTFKWDFDDGSPIVTTGTASQTKTYATAGTYNVKLILNDTNYCNSPDTIVKQFRLSPTVKADFTADNGCAPFTSTFNNTSLAGSSFVWTFGDGGSSVLTNPTYTFVNPGTYTVTLVANDPNTCNFTDTLRKQITINPTPVAGFTFSPIPSQVNTPTQFNNTSISASIYNWNFGDGETSNQINPLYQFNSTGNFNVCLTASNQFGCVDTICQTVPATVEPAIDIANAFTPNGDGKNDKVFVRGFGIKTIQWKIFNRWGQIVFETNLRNVGWDGRFKGQLQPMDAYAYTLIVELSDGRKIKKSGDITLIR